MYFKHSYNHVITLIWQINLSIRAVNYFLFNYAYGCTNEILSFIQKELLEAFCNFPTIIFLYFCINETYSLVNNEILFPKQPV